MPTFKFQQLNTRKCKILDLLNGCMGWVDGQLDHELVGMIVFWFEMGWAIKKGDWFILLCVDCIIIAELRWARS